MVQSSEGNAYQVKLIGGSESKMEWFREDNTEGYSEEILKVMNEKMDKIFANLDEEERENKSYIDYLKEKILTSH